MSNLDDLAYAASTARRRRPAARPRGVLVFASVAVMLAIILALGLVARLPSSQPAAATKEEVRIADAVEMVRRYEANEVAADRLYRGRLVDVSGVVEQISKDLADQPYVILKGPASSFRDVQISFRASAEPELAKLRKGERVTTRGRGEGLFGNVHVKAE